MAAFSPPAYIQVSWTPDGEPTGFVALRECSGAQLNEALRHSVKPDAEALRSLRTLFTRAGGRDGDTIGVVLKLPPPADRLLTPSYVGNPSTPDVGTSDTAFRRRFRSGGGQ